MPGSQNDAPIVLFDGVCNSCNRFVNWIIRHDRRARFRFAPLQSEAGAEVQQTYGLDPSALDTLVLVERGKVHRRSSAALRIVRLVDGPWRVLYGLVVVPPPVLNFLYDWFARNRYRWYGKRDECMVPTPEVRERFLTGAGARK